jgi:hypothetical protein
MHGDVGTLAGVAFSPDKHGNIQPAANKLQYISDPESSFLDEIIERTGILWYQYFPGYWMPNPRLSTED